MGRYFQTLKNSQACCSCKCSDSRIGSGWCFFAADFSCGSDRFAIGEQLSKTLNRNFPEDLIFLLHSDRTISTEPFQQNHFNRTISTEPFQQNHFNRTISTEPFQKEWILRIPFGCYSCTKTLTKVICDFTNLFLWIFNAPKSKPLTRKIFACIFLAEVVNIVRW
jgi:hypothetical protein